MKYSGIIALAVVAVISLFLPKGEYPKSEGLYAKNTKEYINGEIYSTCGGASKYAAVVMESRQYGVPMSKVLELVDRHKGELGGDVEPYVQIVLIAYDVPMYSSETYKQAGIKEFANSTYEVCLKKMTGKTIEG